MLRLTKIKCVLTALSVAAAAIAPDIAPAQPTKPLKKVTIAAGGVTVLNVT